jgi:XTP/dITP diphosphohydrolase
MKEIVFATNNVHKLSEVRRMVGDRFKVRSLSEIGCHDDIPETADTLEGNALIKARWVKDKYGYDCFADDTGLMVDALDGAPGVKTARFAGEHCTPDDNVTKLLEVMRGVTDRNARFSTVIALILDGRETLMEGTVHGTITTERLGTDGFGYDPVFMPEQTGLTFAQMGPDAKNVISHRGRAIARLMEVLNSYGV